MSRTPDQVLSELLAISPPGDVLPSGEADSMWANWLRPFANEISLYETLDDAMLAEIDPASAQYLLTDYERVLGPDPYGRDAGNLTIAQRQKLAHSRWTAKYGVRPLDFVTLAASFGVPISITEFEDLQTNFFADAQCGDTPIEYTWQVNLPASVLAYAFSNEFSAGDLVSSFEPSNVQNVIAARNPAQLTVVFNYA